LSQENAVAAEIELPSSTSPRTSGADWSPGTFALQDAWFPVAHSPQLRAQPILRLVHSRRFHLWRDGTQVRAADHHPKELRSGPLTHFTDAQGHYPVVERYGHVWVWYGGAERADPSQIPDIPFLHPDRAQPGYACGVNFFHTSYELVLENILDLTHIDFVHGAYAGKSGAREDSIRFESTSETVTMIRTVRERPTSAYQRDVLGVKEPYQDQTAFTHVFIRSGVCFLHSHYSSAPSIPLMQSNTPECVSLTRANYVFGVQQTNHKGYAKAWPKTASTIAQQDESVLNPQSTRYVGRPSKPDLSTRFDAAGLHYRARHRTLVDRQQRGDFIYLPDVAQGSDLAEILKIRRLR
jgi:phenylpropionate dioxygenase-like ring-hydroxylating dioxygenase large terminal subunit